jgi:hypothetical protein
VIAGAIDLVRAFDLDPVCALPTVKVTRDWLMALLEYSTTLPTGQAIGKRWRRACWTRPVPLAIVGELPDALSISSRLVWVVGQYVPCPDPGLVGITWRWAECP